MSHRHEPGQHRRPRLLALPLVLLCALAYLGSAAHFVLVQHRACLEHGDLLHTELDAESSPEARLAQASPSFEDERYTRAEAAATEHGSDVHCAHAFLRRVLVPPAGAVLVWDVPRPERAVQAPRLESVEPPVAWLRLAPKASPPRG